ncbi:cupredoxin domain-containing protein [Paenibacillus doosanensis]|uniref:EfeO-type cupredoxin-like domain-containing protein n=1 Tax=Paenibacillus konkukensis TaxID=2020716 RepID=A0ABY4RFY1_9BACL|nr:MULTISPECIES: cupredoxin domain-containing protein [Paenibacillus]MCS7460484.1 cupredoxin domain-containing protein [Paenibacillus doosanensis]UQZ81297.1 hypothetical protein SK3146_00453 [Paenibacillus konkukensis]
MKKKWMFLSAGIGVVLIAALILLFTDGNASAADPSSLPENQGYQIVTVNVKSDGFEPEHIELKAGVPVKLNFKKESNLTCIKNVMFEKLGIDANLDKGNNLVELSDLKPGTYEYHCGMYMYYGTVTVKP